MKTRRDIDNGQDILDSRDIIARIEELQSERDTLQGTFDDLTTERDDPANETAKGVNAPFKQDEIQAMLDEAEAALNEFDESEEGEELKVLTALQEEAEGYSSDWKYGSTLIRDSYFVEYCEELVKDIGDMPKEIPSYIEIDWEKTADNIKADYTSVDFDGVEYWIR